MSHLSDLSPLDSWGQMQTHLGYTQITLIFVALLSSLSLSANLCDPILFLFSLAFGSTHLWYPCCIWSTGSLLCLVPMIKDDTLPELVAGRSDHLPALKNTTSLSPPIPAQVCYSRQLHSVIQMQTSQIPTEHHGFVLMKTLAFCCDSCIRGLSCDNFLEMKMLLHKSHWELQDLCGMELVQTCHIHMLNSIVTDIEDRHT